VYARKNNRYRLNAPVVFFWKDEGNAQHAGTGRTRDIGLGGAFVFTKICPPLEAPLHLEVVLPTVYIEVRPLKVEGDGQVIRVEPGVPGGGFAAAIRHFSLRAGQEPPFENGFLTSDEPGN